MTPPRILLVEDNPIDVKMIKRALKLGGVTEEPQVVNDGAPAIALLSRQNGYRDVTLPDLVVLDLNLITVDGGEVLSFIRKTPALDHVTVTILSSTPRDAVRTETAQADCYFVKPFDLASFESLGRKILDCYSRSGRKPS
jgi:CheY-like chemotaxis protein